MSGSKWSSVTPIVFRDSEQPLLACPKSERPVAGVVETECSRETTLSRIPEALAAHIRARSSAFFVANSSSVRTPVE
jgi:hypothetical protein